MDAHDARLGQLERIAAHGLEDEPALLHHLLLGRARADEGHRAGQLGARPRLEREHVRRGVVLHARVLRQHRLRDLAADARGGGAALARGDVAERGQDLVRGLALAPDDLGAGQARPRAARRGRALDAVGGRRGRPRDALQLHRAVAGGDEPGGHVLQHLQQRVLAGRGLLAPGCSQTCWGRSTLIDVGARVRFIVFTCTENSQHMSTLKIVTSHALGRTGQHTPSRRPVTADPGPGND